MSEIGYIYKYTFPDGKVYIGQTKRPIKARHREHINKSTGPLNPGFWEAYEKFGTAELTVLETVEAESSIELVNILNELETKHIRREKATDPKYGYNKKSYGTSFSPDSKVLREECQRRMKAFYEEFRAATHSIYEKITSGRQKELREEELELIYHNVFKYNLFSDTIKEYLNPEDLSFNDTDEGRFWLDEALDCACRFCCDDALSIICQQIRENEKLILADAKPDKIIQQMDNYGNVLHEFSSWREVKKELKIDEIDNILNVLKKRQKTAYGYRWRYKPSEEDENAPAKEGCLF